MCHQHTIEENARNVRKVDWLLIEKICLKRAEENPKQVIGPVMKTTYKFREELST